METLSRQTVNGPSYGAVHFLGHQVLGAARDSDM